MKLRVFLMIVATSLFLANCTTPGPRNPVPQKFVETADLECMKNVRMWGDRVPLNIGPFIRTKMSEMRRHQPQLFRAGRRSTLNLLALSGGADDGAFGAGLLAGWSASGRRPDFNLVSGVSTGALIAPFAFLGKRYDHVLKELYTLYSTDDLVTKQPLSGLLGGAALADATPLENLISHYVDHRFLREIARQYKRGNVLLVATTNLDAQRPVIWNMGEIAAYGDEEALTLFRKVLRAAIAIPGAFPPVHIKVKVNGKVYEEMHVDGGTTAEVFLLPSQIMFKRIDPYFKTPPRRRMYIIMNNRLSPEWKPIEASLLPISERSLHTVLKHQSIGDLTKLYVLARQDRLDYNLASIGDDFSADKKEFFDVTYMSTLFDYAYQQGRKGYAWQKKPPGLKLR